MKNGILWGLVGGIVGGVCLKLLPQPAGSIAYWATLTVWAGIGAAVVWRRNRLGYVTTAAAAGAVGTGTLAVMTIVGGDVLSLPWLLPVVGSLVLVFVCMLVETWRMRPEFEEWERCMNRVALWEMALFRQIPDHRAQRRSENGLERTP